MRKISFLAMGLALTVATPVLADNKQAITEAVKKVAPRATIAAINPGPMDEFKEIIVDSQVLYISNDGRYLFDGTLIDTERRVDLTEETQKGLRADALDAVKDADSIMFKAPKQKHEITVFTDIDCGYCRKLHNEMPDYHKEGISVKYLFFPRSGPGTESFKKAESVWCAKDSNAAMDQAKGGEKIADAKCDNPIGDQYKLGGEMGVNGTPAIFTNDGTMLPGYIPAKRLAKYLNSL